MSALVITEAERFKANCSAYTGVSQLAMDINEVEKRNACIIRVERQKPFNLFEDTLTWEFKDKSLITLKMGTHKEKGNYSWHTWTLPPK